MAAVGAGVVVVAAHLHLSRPNRSHPFHQQPVRVAGIGQRDDLALLNSDRRYDQQAVTRFERRPHAVPRDLDPPELPPSHQQQPNPDHKRERGDETATGSGGLERLGRVRAFKNHHSRTITKELRLCRLFLARSASPIG